MSIISKDINRAIALLKQEELVAIPTETVYGLAGNMNSEKAVKKIFSTKKRPFYNPLIVHIPSVDDLENIVSYVPTKAKKLAEAFWPGPLTLVLPKKNTLSDLITAGKSTVAVRVPNHPLTLALLKKLPFPVVAPSANPFNCISPTKAIHVERYFKNELSLILDGGFCKRGIESTIIGFENDDPILFRLGAVSIENIEEVIGTITLKNHNKAHPEAPGMLQKHYSPKTFTVLTSDVFYEIEKHLGEKIGVLSFKNSFKNKEIFHEIILSPKGNLEEAAKNLYDSLHELDSQEIEVIIVEKLPNVGLGNSINDRLERAAYQE